uniref:Insulin like growth factor 2 receptor n=1 Tax=Leptobrachium leishanense TaxID=445787 RepID=A0A8C5Q086_9ANUR
RDKLGQVSQTNQNHIFLASLSSHIWEAIDSTSRTHYKINVCENMPASECNGIETAICAHYLNNNTYSSIGNMPVQASANLLVFNSTQQCPNGVHHIQSRITLICGTTLGTPEFVTFSECVYNFEWRTFTACKKNKFKPNKEVPCYVFDEDLRKHDLNPMIGITEVYRVDDEDPDTDLYINICRTVGKLELHYETTDLPMPDFCNGHQPAVTITLICPSASTEETNPRLTANTNCRFEIEWVTENACHRDYLESKDCKFTNEHRDIIIDLSPLTKKPDDVSSYSAHDPSNEYTYYLNVCGNTNMGSCTGDSVSVCQVKTSDQQKKVAGTSATQTLRYSDGDLTLIYHGGQQCSSDFQRTTIINFECNETAVNDGIGVPDFTSETDCTYSFNWETKYACVKGKQDLLCQVTDRRKRYDLSSLIRNSSTAVNWEAVHDDPLKEEKKRFFLNVCHKVLQKGDAAGCEDEAAICAVDKKNLGKFMSAPKKVGDNIQLVYSEGSSCGQNKTIQTTITLMCRPGDLESPPILKRIAQEGCLYEFEWHTAAACVLSKTEGSNCRVYDPQAGFSFDLSPLTKKSGTYVVNSDEYDFYINVCGNVTQADCDSNSGVCQMSKSKDSHWNLGVANSNLSYYDGIIQLSYKDGTPYNDEKKTHRSSRITFLCDRGVDVGQPEYQKEDQQTYNFKWYTKYACPEIPVECVVVDESKDEQYDLSRLSRTQEGHSGNWFAMGASTPKRNKYYINVCRSLLPVSGCDQFASACLIEYTSEGDSSSEAAVISNLGIASKSPVIEDSGRLLLEYSNGSKCTNGQGEETFYTTRIHLECQEKSSRPTFLSNQDCTVSFVWKTDVACPFTVSNIGNQVLILNICGAVKECGSANDKEAAGCEYETGQAVRPVLVDQSLRLSAEDDLTLIYRGQAESGSWDTYTIQFVCDIDSFPGELSFRKQEINNKIFDTFFEFKTALACLPAEVDCQVTDSNGIEYDLSDLGEDGKPWTAVDTSENKRDFYISVCKPLRNVRGCPGGAIGSCMKTAENKYLNLGYIQMSPQASIDGSLSIVYMNGDKCTDKLRYSTRIIFQCDHDVGLPIFQQQDGCEYVFLWKTPEACPVQRAEGDNCQVKHPKYGHIYNLKALGDKDIEVKASDYVYYFKVCGGITISSCLSKAKPGATVSSCQVKGADSKIAGLLTEKLSFENGFITINYTGGDVCHKIYNRSTSILFSCDSENRPVIFLKETPDCSYTFEWRTPLACLPFKPIDCSSRDPSGNLYDLSSLSRYNDNWEVELTSGLTKKYRLNVCKPLVPEPGPSSCSNGASACLLNGSESINIGELASGPRWESDLLVLEYTNGDNCPDGKRKRTTRIRFKCEENLFESRPQFISALEDCEYNFLWTTASACPLKAKSQDKCRTMNPATGHPFDLSSLTKSVGYNLKDHERSIKINICGAVTDNCGDGVGEQYLTFISRDVLTYTDQVLSLVYEDGDPCSTNSNLKHKSVFSFVCGTDNVMGNRPILLSYSEETCTWYFSWHTPLVCEQQEKCSVWNGTSLIDLSSLTKHVGYYKAEEREKDPSDYYINICQPLNPVSDVQCPPGAFICLDSVNEQPVDIGRISSSPQISSDSQSVFLILESTTPCDVDKMMNYSSIIKFYCKVGTDLGVPTFLQKSGCSFVFEWETPVVCPDEVTNSGCSLTDQRLNYTFNLSVLPGGIYKTPDHGTYYIGICSAAMNEAVGKCDGAVCLVSGKDSISFGNPKAVKMNYLHQEEMVELQYTGGDPCPKGIYRLFFPKTPKSSTLPSSFTFSGTERRQSTILFKCDENAGNTSPVLVSETEGCSATFEWKTAAVCLPRKVECKFIEQHKTYDLRMLSSMTGSWIFSHDGNSYFLNLCQRVNQGPPGCSGSASVCMKSKYGAVSVLGQVHTQTVTVKDNTVYVRYSNGEDCGKGKKLSTTLQLTCSNTVGSPSLERYDADLCEYRIIWPTRAACAVVPKEVQMVNGTIQVDNGVSIDLRNIYQKLYTVTGDIRQDDSQHDKYTYQIQLSGSETSSNPKCIGASICQVKINEDFVRAVGLSNKVKYHVDDDDLDVIFTSDSKCGKDKTKNATSTIFFHCSQTEGEGQPGFLHETTDCQYLFSWHTSAVCPLVPKGGPGEPDQSYQGLSGRSQAVGTILCLLLVILIICMAVLLLYKKERRETMIYKLSNCCRRSSNVSYKYSKINTEEEADGNETEWLIEEVSSNHAKSNHENGSIRHSTPRAFTTLNVDDLDSEDEVLTVPEVRIHSARMREGNSNPSRNPIPSEGDDGTLIGTSNGMNRKSGRGCSSQSKKDKMNVVSFHDDSDEDLLNL